MVRLHKEYENLDYDFYKNGEAAVFRKLADIQGFSTTTVFFSPEKSGVATCVPNFSEQFHKYQPQKFEAKVSTGDMFCADKGIETIDFLKIDVEGYEHKVLKGFEGMLKRGNIKIIQFEDGYINIDTHFLLKDFHDYLGGFEMKMGKIYPRKLCLRAFRQGAVGFLREPLVEVRRHRENATSQAADMPHAKLAALQLLTEVPLTPAQRSALNRRVGRALIDSGIQNASDGQNLAAARKYVRAFGSFPNARLSALKNLAMLAAP